MQGHLRAPRMAHALGTKCEGTSLSRGTKILDYYPPYLVFKAKRAKYGKQDGQGTFKPSPLVAIEHSCAQMFERNPCEEPHCIYGRAI